MSSAKLEAIGRASAIRIGVSGWRYPPWRGGAFYPKGLAQHRELEYASRALPSATTPSSTRLSSPCCASIVLPW
jgi:hypothetical protein